MTTDGSPITDLGDDSFHCCRRGRPLCCHPRSRLSCHPRGRNRGSIGLLLLFACMTFVNAELTPRPKILNDVGVVQKLGDSLPLDLPFKDETGRTVRLSEYFQSHKPVLLNFVYYGCPSLCTEVLNGMVRMLRAMPLSAGNDFQIVTVSIDPLETPALAAQKKLAYVDKYNRSGAEKGWAFLTGEPASIKALTDAAGFRYAWDDQIKQFAHGSAIMVVTPEGKLSRYFYGVEYPTQDVRLSLVEASNNKIGSLVDQLLLFCYRYDPTTNRYGFLIMRAIQLSALLTLAALALMVGTFLWREKHA